jgi:2-deoxy-D-gluconate 3-dehydrogenase
MNLSACFSLKDKVAVVTGGAGGIGRAVASTFVDAGATVIVVDISAEAIDEFVRATQRERESLVAYELDVTSESAVEDLFAQLIDKFGHIDVLVNGAGVALRAPALEHSVEAWDKVMSVNVTGTFLCSRAMARRVDPTRGGVIVNIASIMGLSGGGLYPNVSYQTSKGAVVNMTRALALEWAKEGIRVNAVAPTYVRTDFIKAIVSSPPLLARIEAMTPLGRLAEPEDVANATLFLASPASAMITGHILAVDGGFLAQ